MLAFGDVVILSAESFVDSDLNPHISARNSKLLKATNDETAEYSQLMHDMLGAESSKEGFVCSTDKTHSHQCYLTRASDPAVARQTDMRKCLFEILPCLQYGAKTELQDALELSRVRSRRKRSMTMSGAPNINLETKSLGRKPTVRSLTGMRRKLSFPNLAPRANSIERDILQDAKNSDDQHIADLQEAYEAEKRLNEQSIHRRNGDRVLYGEAIQLRHLASGTFLTLDSQQVADLEPDCLQVRLVQEGSPGSWLDLRAPYSVWDEGTPIEAGSSLKFHFRNCQNHFLHYGAVGEVSASSHASLFQIKRFQSFSPRNINLLQIGTVVRIVHPQSGRYVVYDHISVDNFQDERRHTSDSKSNKDEKASTDTHVPLQRIVLESPDSPLFNTSGSLWIVETDAFETGAARWSDSFYLRHLNTHKLLGIAATGELFVGDGFRSDPRDFQLTLSAVSRALDARANAVISMTNGFLIGRQVSQDERIEEQSRKLKLQQMEVSGIKMNITNQKKPDAATAFLTKMKASMKVKDLAQRLRNGRLAPRPIFRDLSHSQLIDDIKCFWVNCEDPTTTLSQDNDSFDSGSDSEDVDTLDGSSDEELHGFENTAQNYDEHANVGSAEGFHHNRLADNRPLRLDAHPVRDLRNAFRFELVNTTEVRDTDAALNGIKQYRALSRSVKTAVAVDSNGLALPNQQWLAEVLDVVGSMILFCTTIPASTQKAQLLLRLQHAQKVATTSAKPNFDNQKLVREQGGIGITFRMLEHLTSMLAFHGKATTHVGGNAKDRSGEETSSSATSHARWMKIKKSAKEHTMEAMSNIRTTCSVLYFFLTCVVEGNAFNQQKAAEWMDDMIDHVSLDIGAADCLTRMLHNNHKLLHGNLVQRKHVEGFVAMITEGGILPLALKFLQVLCVTKRKISSLKFDAVASKQALVCESLQSNEKIHFKFRLSDGGAAGRQCPEILPSELMHLYGEAARASSASRSLATSTARLQHNEEKAATQENDDDAMDDKYYTFGSLNLLHPISGNFMLHEIEVSWKPWGPYAAHTSPQALYGSEWVNLRVIASKAAEFKALSFQNKTEERSVLRQHRDSHAQTHASHDSHGHTFSESGGFPVSKAHSDVMDYLVTSLKLYATMCMQRNYTGILWLEDKLPYDVCLSGLANPKLHPVFRTAFMRLLVHLWIDRAPQRSVTVPFMTRHWQAIRSEGSQNIRSDYAVPSQTSRRRPVIRNQKTQLQHLRRTVKDQNSAVRAQAIADRPQNPGRFVLLQAFILQYFRRVSKASGGIKHSYSLLLSKNGRWNNNSKRASTVARRQALIAQNKLTVEIGLGLGALVRLGFYATVPTFFELSQHLSALLDGRTDSIDSSDPMRTASDSRPKSASSGVTDEPSPDRWSKYAGHRQRRLSVTDHRSKQHTAEDQYSSDEDDGDSDANDGSDEENDDDAVELKNKRSKSATVKLQPKWQRRRRCNFCCSKRDIDAVINSTPYTVALIACVPLSMVSVVLRYTSDRVVEQTVEEEWGIFLVDTLFLSVFLVDVVLRVYLMTWRRYTRDILCVIDFLVSVLDALSFIFSLLALANYDSLLGEQTLQDASSVIELSPILRLTRFARTIRILRMVRVVRAVALARKVLRVVDAFEPAPPSTHLLPRYYQRGVSKTVTNIKIVAVDLLRKFGHINDDIRLNRLVTSCEKLFLNVALGDNQNTTSTPQQATKDPNWNEYMTAFQKGVESLFEHYHHLADEVDGGCKNVRALIKQAKAEAVQRSISLDKENSEITSRLNLPPRAGNSSARIHPVAFVSRGHNTGGDTDTQQLRTYNSKDDLFDDEQKASDESGDEADFHDRPTYSHLTAAEQTLKWLLGQKHHLYFHGSRMWANHEDLHHVSDSLVSGGTLEHEVDAILLDLLLYDDFELAIKALSLLIQKYRRWESFRDMLRSVQMLGSAKEFRTYAVLRGHLIALEHLFEEYEAWKASTDQDTIKTRTGHVEYSISVLCKLLQSDNSSHHRLEAASEAQDAVEEARLHSKDRRGHVQKTLVHLGFAHLIDTAIDIPVECHDFPTWWWNAPMRPSCTNIAAQITTMKPDLVVGTHAGGICFISGTGNEIQSSPTISEEDDNRVHHQPQATFEYIDMEASIPVDFVCRDNGFLSLHEWITRDKSNAPVRQSEYRRRVMLGWLNKLLLDFLAGNPSNQVLLFSKLEFFVHHIGQIQYCEDVVAAIFRGNADLCRSVSHSLLETLVLKMHHSFNHGIFCRGLVDSLVYIVQAAPPLLSLQVRETIVNAISSGAKSLGFYCHRESARSPLHQLISAASTELKSKSSWDCGFCIEFVPEAEKIILDAGFTLPASSERVRAPSAKIQKRQRSGRVLRRRQSSQTQVESIPRSRRSLPADSSADAEKALQEELGEVLHPQPTEIMKTGLVRHFTGAKYCVQAHLAVIRLLLECCGQGSTNNSLIVQKCQTLYPSDVLIPLYVEPGVLWNSKVLYLDLLSYLYIDTAAPTKGFVGQSHLPAFIDSLARTIKIYAGMNSRRPDLQTALQHHLVSPTMDPALRDPATYSLVTDVRQFPAFFLTHVYCQVLPVIATFMSRYGPNLYMASLNGSGQLKTSLSSVLQHLCALFRSTSSLERWFNASSEDVRSLNATVPTLGSAVTSTTLLKWRVATCIAQFEEVFQLLMWDTFNPSRHLDEANMRSLQEAVTAAQRYETLSSTHLAEGSPIFFTTWPYLSPFSLTTESTDVSVIKSAEAPVATNGSEDNAAPDAGSEVAVPLQRVGPRLRSPGRPHHTKSVSGEEKQGEAARSAAHAKRHPHLALHHLIFEKCVESLFNEHGKADMPSIAEKHEARALHLRQNLVKQMLALPQTDASGAVDNCTLPNVLNKMVRLVQSSLEPIPNGARHSRQFRTQSVAHAASQVVSMLRAIVGSAGVTSSGNKVQKRRLSALQHQVSLVGGVELVVSLLAFGIPSSLFSSAVELGIALLISDKRTPTTDSASVPVPRPASTETESQNHELDKDQIALSDLTTCSFAMKRAFFHHLTSTKGACEAFALGIKTRLGQNIDEVMRLEALDDGDTPQVTTWANEIAHLQSVQSSRHYGNAPSRGNMNGTSSRTDHNKTSSFLASSATPTEAKPEWGVRLLQFLYLLCLGGTQREKELFLEQPHASVSVNLLDTFVEYLRTFVDKFCVSKSVLKTIAVTLNLLRSLLDGPCEGNIVYLACKSDLFDILNSLLRNLGAAHDILFHDQQFLGMRISLRQGGSSSTDLFNDVSAGPTTASKTAESQFEAVTMMYLVEEYMLKLLLAMIEGVNNIVVVEKLHSAVKIDLWLQRMGFMRKIVHMLGGRELELPAAPTLAQRRRYTVVRRTLTIGHKLMILIHCVGEHFPTWFETTMQRSAAGKAAEYFDAGLRRVEVFWRNRIQAAYFPTLAMCRSIPQDYLNNLLENVDRQNHDTKLTGFTNIAKDLYFSMRHSSTLKRHRLDVLFSERKLGYAQNFKLIVALLINTFIFLFMEASPLRSDEQHLLIAGTWMERSGINSSDGPSDFITAVGYFQLLAAIYVMVCRYVLSLPVFFARKKNILDCVFHPQILYPFGYVAVCGVALWSGFLYVYCFCLLDIVERSKSVQHVLFAVTRPFKQILLTITLLLIILIIYGFTVFYFNREKVENGECYSMFSCVLWTIFVGMRYGGGIADGIDDFDIYFEQATWITNSFLIGLSFYVLVNLILLNLVFGIIIDKFAELRQDRDKKLFDQENFCFMCGIPRREFELSQHTDFDTHRKQVHNPWAYLQYIVYISEKPSQSLSGLERYVARCLATRKIKWFPQGFASDLMLNGVNDGINQGDAQDATPDEGEDAALPAKEMMDILQRLEQRIQNIEHNQALLSTKNETTTDAPDGDGASGD